MPDTTIKVNHGKRTKRIIVSGRTEAGRVFELKYKRVDDNNILILNKVDSATKIKVSVLAKEPLENQKWYRAAQSVARLMMMVRNVSISYRNQYSMSIPGFKPMVGNMFGQGSGYGLVVARLRLCVRLRGRLVYRQGTRERVADGG